MSYRIFDLLDKLKAHTTVLSSKDVQKLENVGSEKQERWWTVLVNQEDSSGKIAFAKIQGKEMLAFFRSSPGQNSEACQPSE